MKKITAIFLAIFVTGAAIAASAQVRYQHRHHPTKIQMRQHNQEVRIRKGRRSGALTKSEAKHLQRRENRIGRTENRFMRGRRHLTSHQKSVLNHRLNRSSRAIYRKKHNRVRFRPLHLHHV